MMCNIILIYYNKLHISFYFSKLSARPYTDIRNVYNFKMYTRIYNRYMNHNFKCILTTDKTYKPILIKWTENYFTFLK